MSLAGQEKIFSMLREGCDTKEIASHMGVSRETVYKYRRLFLYAQ